MRERMGCGGSSSMPTAAIREITEWTQKITQITERTQIITEISESTPPITQITERTHPEELLRGLRRRATCGSVKAAVWRAVSIL